MDRLTNQQSNKKTSKDVPARQISDDVVNPLEDDKNFAGKTTSIKQKVKSFFLYIWKIATFPFRFLYKRIINKSDNVTNKVSKPSIQVHRGITKTQQTTTNNHKTNLSRFIKIQDTNSDTEKSLSNYNLAKSEIAKGCKKSHWIWYIFPQLTGLGSSLYSKFYGLEGEKEALRYLLHEQLSRRLIECIELVLSHKQKKLIDIFSQDAKKFISSMEIFNSAIHNYMNAGNSLPIWLKGKADIFAKFLRKAK